MKYANKNAILLDESNLSAEAREISTHRFKPKETLLRESQALLSHGTSTAPPWVALRGRRRICRIQAGRRVNVESIRRQPGTPGVSRGVALT